jgi:hypothetical protein
MRRKRVLVAGSRGFFDYEILSSVLDKHYKDEDILIVSGGAKGVDALAEKYARRHKLHMKIFQAEWKTRGKLAGLIRNTKTVDFCDEAIIFWDGRSRGILDTIKKMRRAKKYFRVITGWEK